MPSYQTRLKTRTVASSALGPSLLPFTRLESATRPCMLLPASESAGGGVRQCALTDCRAVLRSGESRVATLKGHCSAPKWAQQARNERFDALEHCCFNVTAVQRATHRLICHSTVTGTITVWPKRWACRVVINLERRANCFYHKSATGFCLDCQRHLPPHHNGDYVSTAGK